MGVGPVTSGGGAMTPAQILTALLTVDGAGSGLNADLLDALNSTAFATTATKLDDFAAPDDNTDLDASASAHGLLPKLSNVATEFFSGTGVFSTPAGGAGALVALKTSNEIVNNSTTMQADDQLTLAVAANTTYLLKLVIFAGSASTADDISVRITGPAGATAYLTQLGIATGAVAGTTAPIFGGVGTTMNGLSSTISSATLGESGGQARKAPQIWWGVVVVAGTAGNVAVEWAQGTLTVVDTTVFAGSHLMLMEA